MPPLACSNVPCAYTIAGKRENRILFSCVFEVQTGEKWGPKRPIKLVRFSGETHRHPWITNPLASLLVEHAHRYPAGAGSTLLRSAWRRGLVPSITAQQLSPQQQRPSLHTPGRGVVVCTTMGRLGESECWLPPLCPGSLGTSHVISPSTPDSGRLPQWCTNCWDMTPAPDRLSSPA